MRRQVVQLRCLAALLLWASASLAADPFAGVDMFGKQPEIRIQFMQTLNFGRIAANKQPGQVRLDPATGGRQTQGVTRLSGNGSIGRLLLRGEPNAEFQIWLPQQIIFMGPGDQLIARDLQAYPAETGRFDAQGMAEISIGGVLEVPADLVGGAYQSRFDITAEYL